MLLNGHNTQELNKKQAAGRRKFPTPGVHVVFSFFLQCKSYAEVCNVSPSYMSG